MPMDKEVRPGSRVYLSAFSSTIFQEHIEAALHACNHEVQVSFLRSTSHSHKQLAQHHPLLDSSLDVNHT